jgi:hypothetical protein
MSAALCKTKSRAKDECACFPVEAMEEVHHHAVIRSKRADVESWKITIELRKTITRHLNSSLAQALQQKSLMRVAFISGLNAIENCLSSLPFLSPKNSCPGPMSNSGLCIFHAKKFKFSIIVKLTYPSSSACSVHTYTEFMYPFSAGIQSFYSISIRSCHS